MWLLQLMEIPTSGNHTTNPIMALCDVSCHELKYDVQYFVHGGEEVK